MADHHEHEIDPEEAEAGIWAAGGEMGLPAERIEEAIRDHRRLGRLTLPDAIARALELGESQAAKKGEPWDDAARSRAVAVGYFGHLHGLIVLRAEIEKRYPGGMETIEFSETEVRTEGGIPIRRMSYNWPSPGREVGRDSPFSAN